MDARLSALVVAVVGCFLTGASYRTQNFIVTADHLPLAQEVANRAEFYRRQLAQQWLGYELKPWQRPIPVQVQVASHLGAGGVTSFIFDAGVPQNWQMTMQGSRQRVLDSVLPHEISHTVFATHFGRPLPRWADEGACTTLEHVSEKKKQHALLLRYLTTDRGIPFNKMLRMKEYPRDIMTLYSQGFSVAQYLIAYRGKRTFVRFLADAMDNDDWDKAIARHYPFQGVSDLQVQWVRWISNGSPPITPGSTNRTGIALAGNHTPPVVTRVDTDNADGERLVPIGYTGEAAAVVSGQVVGSGWTSRQQVPVPGTPRTMTTAIFSRVIQGAAMDSGRREVSRPRPPSTPGLIVIAGSDGTVSGRVTTLQPSRFPVTGKLNWTSPLPRVSDFQNRQ